MSASLHRRPSCCVAANVAMGQKETSARRRAWQGSVRPCTELLDHFFPLDGAFGHEVSVRAGAQVEYIFIQPRQCCDEGGVGHALPEGVMEDLDDLWVHAFR